MAVLSTEVEVDGPTLLIVGNGGGCVLVQSENEGVTLGGPDDQSFPIEADAIVEVSVGLGEELWADGTSATVHVLDNGA